MAITPNCISAYIIRLSPEGARYLLIRRCGKYLPGTWQMVSGGVEQGETAPETALREIREETGLTPSAFYSADAVETFYMTSCNKIISVPVFVAFVEDEIVRLSPKEHDAYEWLAFEQARDRLVWVEQKRVIAHIHSCFVLNEPNRLLLIENIKPTISRTGVYGIAMQNRKMLLVKQRKGPHAGKWDLPGGGMESGETIESALQREFQEEVGMKFDTMRFFQNLTAMSEGIDETGNPYQFYQIGMIYQIDGLSQMDFQTTEMEHAWVDLDQLGSQNISPFVRQILTFDAFLEDNEWTMRN